MIKTFKKIEYKGLPIYIRIIGTWTWEYLIVIKGEIYTAHIIVKPKIIKRATKNPYTQKEMLGIVNWLIKAAKATIDYTLKSKKTKKVLDDIDNKIKNANKI